MKIPITYADDLSVQKPTHQIIIRFMKNKTHSRSFSVFAKNLATDSLRDVCQHYLVDLLPKCLETQVEFASKTTTKTHLICVMDKRYLTERKTGMIKSFSVSMQNYSTTEVAQLLADYLCHGKVRIAQTEEA